MQRMTTTRTRLTKAVLRALLATMIAVALLPAAALTQPVTQAYATPDGPLLALQDEGDDDNGDGTDSTIFEPFSEGGGTDSGTVEPYSEGGDYNGDGDGSGDSWINAIHITTQEELAAINPESGTNSKYYILDNDIELTGLTGSGWMPIGSNGINSSVTFSGHFDGAGHTISGLWINRTTYVGLFGCLSGSPEIKNLNIVIDDANGGVKGTMYAGGLVGSANGTTTISNCSVTGSVTGTNYVGGLAAFSSNGLTVSNCYADSTVTGTSRVGGLVGAVTTANISNSHASSTVTATGANSGGLIGSFDQSTVSDCSADSIVTGTTYVGGLVGVATGGNNYLSDSFSAGKVSGTSSVGGLVGEFQRPTGSPRANNISNTYSTANVTGTTGYVGGLIGNLDLGSLANSYAANGTVTSTATSGGTSAVGGLLGSASAPNNFAVTSCYAANTVVGSWQAGALVGRWASTSIVPANSYVDTETSGQTKVIGLTNNANAAAAVNGRTTAQMAGRFASYNLSALPTDVFGFRVPTEDFCYYPELKVFMDSTDAAIRAASEDSVRTTAQTEVSGAVLTAIGSSRPNTATAIVDFSSDSFGLYYYTIVGRDAPTPAIDTTGEGDLLRIGANKLTFTDWADYTAKDIYLVAKNPAGELGDPIKIAIDEADITAPALTGVTPLRLTNHTAAVTFESDEVGTFYYAVVDKDTPMPAIDYQSASKALVVGTNSIAVTGLGADEQVDIYILARDTSGNLSASIPAAVGTFEGYYQDGDGSGDSWINAIHITTQAQLEAVRPASGTNNRYYILDNDIALTGLSGVGWVPIGSSMSTNFTGHFDGDDHIVSGLWTDRFQQNTGLFGYLAANAEIRNLNVAIDDTVASGGVKSTSNSVGGLAGYADTGVVIDNCSVTGNVIGAQNVGGLIGYSISYGVPNTISNSHADSAVTGTSNVGGLVGNTSKTDISNSFSTGSVTGTGPVGGLVGLFTGVGTVTNTYSSSNVTGTTDYVGGLMGNFNGGNGAGVSNSYVANGTVASTATSGATSAVGGLFGNVANNMVVTSCYAANTVVGSWQAGAFVGNWASTTTVSVNSYVDTETSGQADVIGLTTNADAAAAITALSTDRMAGSAALNNMAGLNGDPATFAVRLTDTEYSYYPELIIFKDSAYPAVAAASKASVQTDAVETIGPLVGAPGSGDFDGNGNTTIDEALLLVQFINNDALDTLSEAQFAALDINGDDELTMADALLIVQIILKAA